jgi:hypothetical protein
MATTRNKHRRKHHRARTTNAHPVAIAMLRSRLATDLARLRVTASLHAYTGDNVNELANLGGRLAYMTAYACGCTALTDDHGPDVNILRGMSEALGDLVAQPSALELHRPSIISGLAAIERLLPDLPDWTLAAGALNLEHLLATTAGVGTADVRAAIEGIHPKEGGTT